MASDAVIGLDLGTSSVKGLLIDARDARVLARGRASLTLNKPRRPGEQTQDPESWWQALKEVLRQLLGRATDCQVRAIAVAGQQHGAVLTDALGNPTGPARLWCDTSTAAEAAELSALIKRPVPVGYTASKIRWAQRHEPERYAQSTRVFLPASWIGFRLTGVAAIDVGDASGTGFFDPVAASWDQEAIASLGGADVLRRLPELRRVEDLDFGRVSKGAAAETGLPAGIPLVKTSGDNMMSAVGAFACNDGDLVLSLGTSATLFGPSDRLPKDPDGLVAPFSAAFGAPYLPLICVMNGLQSLEAFRAALGFEDQREASKAAAMIAPGCDGLRCLPFLLGERVPALPEAKGSLHGLTLHNWTAPHAFRAAIEGLGFLLASGQERLVDAGFPPERPLKVVGGGSAQEGLLIALSAALNRDLDVVSEVDTAAYGAALLALGHEGDPEDLAKRLQALSASGSALSLRRIPRPDDSVVQATEAVHKDLKELMARLFPAVRLR